MIDSTIHFGDCITGMRHNLNDDSIDLMVSSIPFGALFSYSGKTEDIGNNIDGIEMHANQFGLHFRFFLDQLYRIMKPGSVSCIHIQQLLAWKVQHGYMGMRDFRGAIVTLFKNHGFEPQGEVAIPKNPQAVARRLNLHSLMFATAYKDSRKLAPAMNDYVLFFKKPGEGVPCKALIESNREIKLVEPSPIIDYSQNQKRVIYEYKTTPYEIETWTEKAGTQRKTVTGGKHINPDGWMTKNDWIGYASGVWDDIMEIDTLDGYKCARETDEERHVCLARGSLVLTKEGHKPIQDIEIGDLVLTHMGRWRKVLAKEMTGINPTVKVYAQGVCDLTMTPNHKVWARDSNGSLKPKHTAAKNGPEWIEAKDLKGKFVNLKLPETEIGEYALSPIEWWLVGRWIADGHIDKRNVAHISCGYAKLDEIKNKCGDYLGNPRMNRTAAQIPIKDTGNRIRNVLYQCGRRAINKKLPPQAFVMDSENSKYLLDGYLSGDGYLLKERNRWMMCSVSKELVLGLQLLIQRVYGVIPSIHAGRPRRICCIEGREVSASQEWNLSFQTTGYGFGFMADDGAWKKVKRVEEGELCETWNIRVEEDESYTAEGCIVKNCPLQLGVIRKCIKLYSAPGELVLDPFMGIGSTAYVAIEQGRNSVGFELKESYHAMALKNVEKAKSLFLEGYGNKESQLKLFA